MLPRCGSCACLSTNVLHAPVDSAPTSFTFHVTHRRYFAAVLLLVAPVVLSGSACLELRGRSWAMVGVG